MKILNLIMQEVVDDNRQRQPIELIMIGANINDRKSNKWIRQAANWHERYD